MHYLSTRGGAAPKAFLEILQDGLAPDGGLYVPQEYPQVSRAQLQDWRGLGYAELATEILALFATDIPRDTLAQLCARTYTAQAFAHPQVVSLEALEDGISILGLSHGPTLAFKDVAMQLLGNLFDFALARSGEQLNILGATSGDTGSAAEYAMRGKARTRVFMLSPFGRMSAFQTAQMYSLTDANIHNLAVQGVFDDCQDIVKAVSEDAAFKFRYRIGTVNSINWARIAAQVVYYFWGYFRATTDNDTPVSFAVPTGNFGNVCAGHIARMMGLPIRKLVLATNENDVLDVCLRDGRYEPRAASEVVATSSPSMDIAKASNLERFIFDLLGRNATATRHLFVDELKLHGRFQLSDTQLDELRGFGLYSGSGTHLERVRTIADTWKRLHRLIDPHTADALKQARHYHEQGVPMLVLETAQPAKFSDTIREAIGEPAHHPDAYAGLENRPQRFSVLPPSVEAVKDYIRTHVAA